VSGVHRFKFFRAGGVDQATLGEWCDVHHLRSLDPKLWVALAMPTRGTQIDERTLKYLDRDGDGRVRQREILEAVDFLEATLEDPGVVLGGGDGVALDAIQDADVLASARIVVEALGKAGTGQITLADVTAYGEIVASLRINGDGVLPPSAAEDPETRALIEALLETVGGVADLSGERGVDQAHVDAFFAQAQAHVDWYAQGEGDPLLLPLGPATADAAAALDAVRAKVDDYFTRCRLAALDPRAEAAMNGADADLVALAARELASTAPEVARLPIARVGAGRALPLASAVNPAWVERLEALARLAAAPLLGAERTLSLTEADWAELKARLSPHIDWAASRPASAVGGLGVARLREVLASPAKAKLTAMIVEDAARDALNKRVAEVERLLLYKRDLFEVLNNFVNFSRFYDRKLAAFQAGTLFLDGRSCALCFDVADAGKHAELAGMAAVFLVYVECTRGTERRGVAAAFTDGDADNLFVGRNGMFVDRQGRDWDATVTKLVANPISIRQAFWTPYKKFVRLVEAQLAKRGAETDERSQSLLAGLAKPVGATDPAAPTPPGGKPIDVGTVAAIGVAVGGIGAMVTGILGAFLGLGMWMPLGLLGIVLLISGPSVLLAFLKLRHRNLGPILDANGWAINGRARITVPFGGALTSVARLPEGAERVLDDPYSDEGRPWWVYVLVVALLLGVAAAVAVAAGVELTLPMPG
jgi:hypothetical protein